MTTKKKAILIKVCLNNKFENTLIIFRVSVNALLRDNLLAPPT